MKNLFIIALVAVGVYQAWGQFGGAGKTVEPLKDEPYVVVYGRDSCGFTSQMRRELAASDVSFEYRNIDRQEVADRIHERMRATGIDTTRYQLPVVDVNGRISTRRDPDEVVNAFEEG